MQVLDNKGLRRRFRACSTQTTTRIKPFICSMPLRLDSLWNMVYLNVGDLTTKAYGTTFVEVIRVQIHASCRIRRAFFTDQEYKQSKLPLSLKPSG